MALIPEICVGVKTNCGILVVKDITDSYNASTNVGGWGSPNITTADVETAYIYITPPNTTADAVIDPIDVTASLPVTVTGTFLLDDITITPLDGEYTILYEITTTGNVKYTKTIKIFSSCLVRCCIDKMWSKYASADADCDCCKETETTALKAEALYRAMNSSAACLDSSTRTKLLKKLQRLCELENCNCS